LPKSALVEKFEFEPRLAEVRCWKVRLKSEAMGHQDGNEKIRSLQLVIGKFDLFATMVRDRLAARIGRRSETSFAF
jgi:hypothetical protein